jgi:hypothetical protein
MTEYMVTPPPSRSGSDAIPMLKNGPVNRVINPVE